jgi:hypothetical protein
MFFELSKTVLNTEYKEYQVFCPFLGIGSPHPLTKQASVYPYLDPKGEGIASAKTNFFNTCQYIVVALI